VRLVSLENLNLFHYTSYSLSTNSYSNVPSPERKSKLNAPRLRCVKTPKAYAVSETDRRLHCTYIYTCNCRQAPKECSPLQHNVRSRFSGPSESHRFLGVYYCRVLTDPQYSFPSSYLTRCMQLTFSSKYLIYIYICVCVCVCVYVEPG
jgi:hypothetical protein